MIFVEINKVQVMDAETPVTGRQLIGYFRTVSKSTEFLGQNLLRTIDKVVPYGIRTGGVMVIIITDYLLV